MANKIRRILFKSVCYLWAIIAIPLFYLTMVLFVGHDRMVEFLKDIFIDINETTDDLFG